MGNIENILIERGYPENAATVVSRKLSNLSGQLRDAASSWLDSGSEPVVSSHGYSTKSLMERFPGMKYPAALLTIDWLERDPEKAKSIIEKGIR